MSAGPRRRGLRTALTIVAVLVVAGVGLGAAWAALAPANTLVHRDGGWFLSAPQQESGFAQQAVFLGLALLTGLIAGVIVWRRDRMHPVAAVLGLTLGGLACAAVAAWVGGRLGPPDLGDAANGTLADAPLTIDARGVLLGVAWAAVAYFFVRLLLAEEPDGQRPTDATTAEVNETSAAGDSPMSSPRLPPET